MNTVHMLPNLMNLSMLPPAQDMIGAPKGKRKLEALQAHQERRQIDFDQFEVTETPVPEVFGDRPNAVLRAPGFAPALRMLSAMLSKVVLDMIGTEHAASRPAHAIAGVAQFLGFQNVYTRPQRTQAPSKWVQVFRFFAFGR